MIMKALSLPEHLLEAVTILITYQTFSHLTCTVNLVGKFLFANQGKPRLTNERGERPFLRYTAIGL